MSAHGGDSLQREQVVEWFQRSAGLFESLSACCVIVESILVGSPAANLAAAKELQGPIHDTEVELLADPCPDVWGSRQLNSIIATLAEIRSEAVMAFGDVDGAEHLLLKAKVDSARRMVTELQRLAARLLSGDTSRSESTMATDEERQLTR
jgi:hypothetical protein